MGCKKIFVSFLIGLAVSIVSPLKTYAQTNGLIAAYGFDSSVTPNLDNSGNNLNLLCTVGSTCPTYTSTGGHKSSGAYNFSGVGKYLTIPNESQFDFANQMTVSFWMKNNVFDNSWEAMVAKGNSSWNVERYGTTRNVSFSTRIQSVWDTLRPTTTVDNNTWHHIAVTYDGKAKRVYIDGVQKSSRAYSGQLDHNDQPVTLGFNLEASGDYSGLLDDVRIYNRPLTRVEIVADMNTPVANQPAPSPSPSPTPTPTPTSSPSPSVVPSPSPSMSPTPFPLVGMGILGDSGSDEYRADDNRGGSYASTTFNWDELLVRFRGMNLGLWGTRDEPRRTGYEYNWARSGAKTADIIAGGQASGLAAQVSSGLVSHVLIKVGANDFSRHNGTYEEIYNGTLAGQALQQKIDSIVSDLATVIDTLQAAGPVRIVLANIPDRSVSALYQSLYPDPQKRQRVTDTIIAVDQRLLTMANAKSVALFDYYNFGSVLAPQIDANGYLHIGTELIDVIRSGDEPHHALLADDEHLGTVLEGIIANSIVSVFNVSYATDITPFTESELITHAGIVLMSPSPSPNPSPSPSVVMVGYR